MPKGWFQGRVSSVPPPRLFPKASRTRKGKHNRTKRCHINPSTCAGTRKTLWADRYVSQVPRQARHFYRALLQAALFCPTRPYLPTDDAELALYADADPADWQTHKAVVLHKFTKVTIEGVELWSHKRLLEQWEKIQKEYSQWSEMGKKSGESRKPKAEPPPNHGSTAVQPELNNIGSGCGSGSGNGNGKRNND